MSVENPQNLNPQVEEQKQGVPAEPVPSPEEKPKKIIERPPRGWGRQGRENLTAELQRPEMTVWSIMELHRQYKPEVIFMIQTGSTLYGWAIKEIYNEAWPEEKSPIILTIDVSPAKYKNGIVVPPDNNNKEFLEIQKIVEEKLKKYNINGNIAVIDETRGYTENLDRFDFLSPSGQGHPVFEPNPIAKKGEPGYFDDGHRQLDGSLGYAYEIIKESTRNLKLSSKVACLGLGGLEREDSSPWVRVGESRLSYRRVKGEEEREHTRKRIEDLKGWGKAAGKEIAEHEKIKE